MKPETSKVWNVIKRNLVGFWERVENGVGPGTPDTDFCIDGVAGKVELKYLPEWPKKESTKTNLEIRPAQRIYLEQYAKNGGRGFVLARVGNEWLLIPANKSLTPTTRSGWIGRAMYYDSVSPDARTMVACLTSPIVWGQA
jgi:hypothetical protein